ncbi:hypothetical protein Tco_0991084 [Tanacetum coccineum]|uniref:Uncharacterized protein n=1 Tax=Tanacetum coccineum TaxID=301880 RepID=A0ABQ5EYJ4_9ASTR
MGRVLLYGGTININKMDLLFGPLYDEFFNAGTSRVNKSSSPTDNSAKQDTIPSMNIQPPSEPSTPIIVHAEENNDNQAEFTNPFCTLGTFSQAVNKSPTHYPCDSARTFRVILFSIHNDEWKSFQCHHQTALRSYALSWKPCQGDSLNLPDHRIHKDGDGDASFQLKSDSLPHAHAQTTKTFYKHQDSRIMKAQELKTKTSAQTLIYKIFLQRYQVYQGRLLASFQDDAKYEHVGQDTRSQGGKDDQDKQGKDLKISDIKTKSKDNDKGSRSKITKHEGTSLQRIQRPRPQDLNDKSNLIDLTKECHNELTSGEIVSLKILSRTRKFVHYISIGGCILRRVLRKRSVINMEAKHGIGKIFLSAKDKELMALLEEEIGVLPSDA